MNGSSSSSNRGGDGGGSPASDAKGDIRKAKSGSGIVYRCRQCGIFRPGSFFSSTQLKLATKASPANISPRPEPGSEAARGEGVGGKCFGCTGAPSRSAIGGGDATWFSPSTDSNVGDRYAALVYALCAHGLIHPASDTGISR